MIRHLLLAAAFAALIPTTSAQAMDSDGVHCLPRQELNSYLGRAWNESRQLSGDLENGNPMAIYVSRRGSWTLVEFRPDGQACVHASGSRMSPHLARETKRSPAS